MNRKQKIGIILISVGLLALLAWLLWPRGTATPAPTMPASQPATTQPDTTQRPEQPVVTSPEPTAPAQPAVTAPNGSTSIARLAAAFVERYGSYSNHGDFENLRDLEVMMDPSLAARTEEYIVKQGLMTDVPAYEGVTTQALKSTIVSYNEGTGRAEVTVQTRRSFSDGRLVFQNITLKYVKSDDKWLVSEAAWDNQQESAR